MPSVIVGTCSAICGFELSDIGPDIGIQIRAPCSWVAIKLILRWYPAQMGKVLYFRVPDHPSLIFFHS